MLCLGMARTAELKPYVIRGYAQGTAYAITYYAQDSLVSRGAVEQLLAAIDSSMSLYKPYSLINRINSGGKGLFEIDSHFRRVMRRSLAIHRDSQGAFDITVAPLVALWGFGVEPVDQLPDSAAVSRALACVGMDQVRLRKRGLRKRNACVKLDMNGIAQGYTVDELATLLESSGVSRYVVELGGEIRVKGPKPDGTPMSIGIERPADRDGTDILVSDVIELTDGAITTAGGYRRFLQDGERRITHHINPKTGYPFDSAMISATVYAKDAMTADGYDNIFMAMSAEEAIAFADNRDDIEVYVVYQTQSGAIADTMSAGFRHLMANY